MFKYIIKFNYSLCSFTIFKTTKSNTNSNKLTKKKQAITFYTVGINSMSDLDSVLNNIFGFSLGDLLLPTACFEDGANLDQVCFLYWLLVFFF